MSDKNAEGRDFFPLTVEYEERFYAAGKILGSRFIRRESRPSDEAILTARAIDRAIRPRFPGNLRREIQVVVTCLSWDSQNDPDTIGLLAASLALSISDIPWQGPLAVLRIGQSDQGFILNPVYEEREKSQLDFLLAGPGHDIINMIEMEAGEKDEKTILEAWRFAKPYSEKLIDFQKEIIKKAGKEKIVLEEETKDPELEKEARDFLGEKLGKALYPENGQSKELDLLKEELQDIHPDL